MYINSKKLVNSFIYVPLSKSGSRTHFTNSLMTMWYRISIMTSGNTMNKLNGTIGHIHLCVRENVMAFGPMYN